MKALLKIMQNSNDRAFLYNEAQYNEIKTKIAEFD